jgi:hypothetical protein
MAGHHTGDQPRTPCGGLGAPALSHAPPPPGWHPGPGPTPAVGPAARRRRSRDAGQAAALATVNRRARQARPTPPPPFPSGPMRAGDHAARGHGARRLPAPGLGGPPHRATPESSAARIARRQRCGHQRPVRPDTWMPGRLDTGRLDTGRPLDRLDGHPTVDRTRRTGQRPAWPASGHPRDRRPPAGQSDLARSRRPGRSTQDGSAVMAPAPRPDRRRHWTAASIARHEAAPRRTALVLELDGTRRAMGLRKGEGVLGQACKGVLMGCRDNR